MTMIEHTLLYCPFMPHTKTVGLQFDKTLVQAVTDPEFTSQVQYNESVTCMLFVSSNRNCNRLAGTCMSMCICVCPTLCVVAQKCREDQKSNNCVGHACVSVLQLVQHQMEMGMY